MKRNLGVLLAILLAAALLTACGSKVKPYRDLDSSAVLKQKLDRTDTLIYKKPSADGKKYVKFLFEPVRIYHGPDDDFGNTSRADQETIAAFIDKEFKRVLKGKYEITDTSGPGVMRVRFTLVGMQVTRPALATATHLVPIGLATNIAKGAGGMSGSFMGSVSLAGEFYDGQDNTLVYAFVTKRGPNAMDVTAMFTGLDAARHAVTDLAEKFLETIDRAHGKVKP